MANKGPLDTKIDVGALNEIIIFANSYKSDVSSMADEIRRICQTMEDDESLKGGDGEVIRENFAKIAVGCANLAQSTDYISHILDNKLGPAIEMRHGKAVGSSTDTIDTAAKKVGVKKE